MFNVKELTSPLCQYEHDFSIIYNLVLTFVVIVVILVAIVGIIA